jgi:hypothetical protein
VESDDEVELLKYREKVIAELERRMLRVQEIDQRLADAQFTLEAALRGKRLFSASTARIQVEAAHKARLRELVKELRAERVQGVMDLERAQVRLKEVDERLDALVEKDPVE